MKSCVLLLLSAFCLSIHADELPLIHHDTFDDGAEAWHPSQPDRWKISEEDGNKVLHNLGASKKYKPPVRSPHTITLLKDKVLGDFVLTAKVKTLQTTRGHRDMDVFFGYQDPSHFYYVHLGEKPDPHSSQIFIVNGKPRSKITETPDIGVPWQDGTWHPIKVVRNVESGLIEIYFDDMDKPQKVAHDKTFAWGMVGLGSFDDLGMWDDVKINGVAVDGKNPVLFEQAK